MADRPNIPASAPADLAEEQHRARRFVASRATDAADAAQLLDALGLGPVRTELLDLPPARVREGAMKLPIRNRAAREADRA